jgi:hypothetical protein
MNIIKYIRQSLCTHIWKIMEEEYLGSRVSVYYDIVFHRYDRYAVHSTCILCDKTRIEEQEVYKGKIA